MKSSALLMTSLTLVFGLAQANTELTQGAPIPAPAVYDQVPLRGANIAAAEFSSPDPSWIIKEAFPNEDELIYFAKKGMNTFRFPIRWSYAQPKLMGDLNAAYVDKLVASTKLYLDAGYTVIIDLHSYMQFQAQSNIEPNEHGVLVSALELTDFWNKLSDRLKPLALQYPDRLMFDLMNEPMNNISSEAVLERYNAVIAMLRAKNINNWVLLEGAHWSGMHSWTSEYDMNGKTNADIFTPQNITDPKHRYAINVHQYFDSNHSGTQVPCTNLPKEKITAFLNWTQENNVKFMVTEFGGADAGNCQDMINEYLGMIHASEQLMGWTLWSGGRYWGNYMLSIYLNGGAVQLPSALSSKGYLKQN